MGKGGGRQPFGMQQLLSMMRQYKGGGKGFSPNKTSKVVSKFGKKPQTQQPKAAKVGKTEAQLKILEKLKETDPSLKVWVGGLTPGFDWKKLQKFFAKVARPKLVHVYDKGTAVATFDSEDKVGEAIATLNGSELDGKKLEVDVWTKVDKADKADRVKKPKKLKQQPKMAISSPAKRLKHRSLKPTAKAAGKPKVDEKLMAKLKEVDSSLKVWVGGLAKSTTWKKLREHFVKASAKPKLVNINEKSRNGVVTFAEESEVQEAIGLLSGSELDGKPIELDVWVRPERKEKVKA